MRDKIFCLVEDLLLRRGAVSRNDRGKERKCEKKELKHQEEWGDGGFGGLMGIGVAELRLRHLFRRIEN